MLRSICAALVALVALAGGEARAERHALLIGVSDYDNPNIRDLHGPRNDVTMMWRLLKTQRFKPENITVVSDLVTDGPDYPRVSALPTHVAILSALDALKEKAEAGDFIVIYYSGHGTDQPDMPGGDPEPEPEANGVDQVLLPRDAGQADEKTGLIVNGLVDDELGAAISAIRAKGAFVWAIIDACQSATATRGGDIVRSVNPALLGVRGAIVIADSEDRHREGQLSPKAQWSGGGFAGFYASDLKSQAIERNFPNYDPFMPQQTRSKEGAENMGAFTFHLHRALTLRKPTTLRELMRDMMADMRSGVAGGAVPPPVFDGDLDQRLFEGASAPVLVQAEAEKGRITIHAGRLQGFEAGSEIALHATNDPLAEPFARAQVVSADYQASVAEVAPGTTLPDGALWVNVTQMALGFDFLVARPPESELTDPAVKAKVEAVLAQAFAQGGYAWRSGLKLQPADAPGASVFLHVDTDGQSDAPRLWLVRSNTDWIKDEQAIGATVRFGLTRTPEEIGRDVGKSLWLFARADKLIRLASALGAGPTGGDLDIDARLVPMNEPSNRICPDRNDEQGTFEGSLDSPRDLNWPAFSAETAVIAHNCDELDVVVSNSGRFKYYIGAFYIDARGGIMALRHRDPSRSVSDCHRVLAPGERIKLTRYHGGTVRMRPRIVTWDAKGAQSAGTEHLVVIAIPENGLTETPDLCKLAQETQPVSTRGTIKGEGDNARLLNDLMDSVLLDAGTRGGSQFEVVRAKTSITGRLMTVSLRP